MQQVERLTELKTLEELDQFFVRYGELIGPGHGRIADCRVNYGQGHIHIVSPRKVCGRLGVQGPEAIDEFFSDIREVVKGCAMVMRMDPYLICRLELDGRQPLAYLMYWTRYGGEKWPVTHPVAIRMICEELMGYPTPLLDWLQDNSAEFYKLVSQ